MSCPGARHAVIGLAGGRSRSRIRRIHPTPHIIDRRLFDKSSLLKRVLITRPEPGATETAARLVALGLSPIIAPVLSIVARDVRAPNRVVATLLTSQNAVAACSPALHDHPVFAVGTATAKRANEAGFNRVFNADGDAGALANLVANMLSPADGSLYLPTGQGQGTDLATLLRRRGFHVIRRVAYQAMGVPALPETAAICLRRHQLAAAMFFSGETARHFAHLLRTAELSDAVRDVEAVSISERAAMALRSLPWRRICVAAKPNQDAMLVLLK
ncbi:uroporphyrinogen-III synthase [Acidisphaera sp. S103]|uniref:uroporphyrinogen-III synthase n=1 Tax=Acidisphaera sp. S103 TaxID=1747223 RepID=UPI00131AF448|nr:uroporphyrinogen-III synthase [Acidisphaera sp. S103]